MAGLLKSTILVKAHELAQRDALGFWRAPHPKGSAYATNRQGWIQAAEDTCRIRGRPASQVFLKASDHPGYAFLPDGAEFANVDASAVIISGPIPNDAWPQPPERDSAFWGIRFPLVEELTRRSAAAYARHREIPLAFVPLPGNRHLAVAGQKPTDP